MKVSVIVASYNYGTYLRETLESLLSQTWRDWEALVVDDGSSDDSVEIIREYARRDSRIRLLQHPGGENRGLPATVRLGVEEAKGQWIAFCESDDSLLPEALERHLAATRKHPETALSFGRVELVGEAEDRAPYEKYWGKAEKWFPEDGLPVPAAPMLEHQNPVFTFSCAMARADLLKKCRFDSPFSPWLDWWLWRQVGRGRQMCFLREPVARWRIHSGSMMHGAGKPSEHYEEFLAAAQKMEDELPLPAEVRRPNADESCWPSEWLPLVRVKKSDEKQDWQFLGGALRGTRYRIPLLNQTRSKALKYTWLARLFVPGARKKRDKYVAMHKRMDELLFVSPRA